MCFCRHVLLQNSVGSRLPRTRIFTWRESHCRHGAWNGGILTISDIEKGERKKNKNKTLILSEQRIGHIRIRAGKHVLLVGSAFDNVGETPMCNVGCSAAVARVDFRDVATDIQLAASGFIAAVRGIKTGSFLCV